MVKIIAVDFDGTLCREAYPEIGKPNTILINTLRTLQTEGNKLILWTCRSGQLLNQAVQWCAHHKLVFDAVNENIPEIIEKYGRDSRKITYDILIDDRNIDAQIYSNNNNNVKLLKTFLDDSQIYGEFVKYTRSRLEEMDGVNFWQIPLPDAISDNGQQYLVLDKSGKYFICALSTASRHNLKYKYSDEELEKVPSVYRQYACRK